MSDRRTWNRKKGEKGFFSRHKKARIAATPLARGRTQTNAGIVTNELLAALIAGSTHQENYGNAASHDCYQEND